MLLTFVLLAFSICAVWAPDIRLAVIRHLPPWVLLFTAAMVGGFVYGVLAPVALGSLILLFGCGLLAHKSNSGTRRSVFTVLAVSIAIGLSLHLFPGFHNPTVVSGVRITENATPFTQYANFDKAAAGLALLVFFCKRCQSPGKWRSIALPVLSAIGGTSIVVILFAVFTGYVDLEPKLPAFAPAFLAVNLLFTCVAEESLFRGVIQERLAQACPRQPSLAVALSALLFGFAHLGGGLLYVALATIAGVGYALVYAATRRVEASILTHFGVNAIHFFGFTYPHLAR